MNKRIQPNAIVVAVIGIILATYIGWKHHTWGGFAIMAVVTIIAATLVHLFQKRHKSKSIDRDNR